MNDKKRSAPDLPLYRNTKRARTAIRAEKPDTRLSEDWMSLLHNFTDLTWRTVTQFKTFVWPLESDAALQLPSSVKTVDAATTSSSAGEIPSQSTHHQQKHEPISPPGTMGPPRSRPLRSFTLSSDAASSSTSIPTPPPSDSTAASSSRTNSPTSKTSSFSAPDGPKRRSKPHILNRQHKTRIQKEQKEEKDENIKKLFGTYAAQGYQSDFNTFKDYLGYRQRVEMLGKQNVLRTSPSAEDMRSAVASPPRSVRSSSFSGTPRNQEPSSDFVRDLLASLTRIKNEPIPLTPSYTELLEQARQRDERINQRLRPKAPPLPTALPPADEAQVTALLSKNGVIAKYAKEQVSSTDLARLRPRSWLNDEIINFYGAMLLGRSDDGKKAASGKSLDIHYFSSFFWAKLIKDGYQGGNLARWTKKAKVDIFAKDAVLIPINHDNTHWTAAIINFKRKRIESYDSLTSSAKKVFKPLRTYLDEEHKNKKQKPFDFTGWEDYAPIDTPQQENAYDCGVFTCQFMASASRGAEAFNFTQKDIPYLRRRMVWEIGNARLRDD